MKVCGIYKIENLTNNKIYIGSSYNINKRWNEHKQALKYNRHKNPHLQASYNKYGAEKFQYSILEECPEENLIEREQYWLDYLCNLYNQSICSSSPMQGRKHSEESKKLMSKTRIERKIGVGGKRVFTEEHKKNISKSNKGKHNRVLSEETKNKISLAHKGKIISEETKEKLRKINLGKKISEETRKKISNATKGVNNPRYGIILSDKTKKKISQSQIGKRLGEKNAFYGKKHSLETKDKMKKAWEKRRLVASGV